MLSGRRVAMSELDLMAAIDQPNCRYGRVVYHASENYRGHPAPKQNWVQPAAIRRAGEPPIVH